MARSAVHPSGALLLDPRDLYRLDTGLYSLKASGAGPKGPCSSQPAEGGGLQDTGFKPKSQVVRNLDVTSGLTD